MAMGSFPRPVMGDARRLRIMLLPISSLPLRVPPPRVLPPRRYCSKWSKLLYRDSLAFPSVAACHGVDGAGDIGRDWSPAIANFDPEAPSGGSFGHGKSCVSSSG